MTSLGTTVTKSQSTAAAIQKSALCKGVPYISRPPGTMPGALHFIPSAALQRKRFLFPLTNKETGSEQDYVVFTSAACSRQASILNPMQTDLHVSICAD